MDGGSAGTAGSGSSKNLEGLSRVKLIAKKYHQGEHGASSFVIFVYFVVIMFLPVINGKLRLLKMAKTCPAAG